jgi:hypothetical protein
MFIEGIFEDNLNLTSDRISLEEFEALKPQKEEGESQENLAYKALWRAVITQALMDAGNNFKKPEYKSIKAHAISWLNSDSDDFNQVCIMADLNPEYVKQKAKEAINRNCVWRSKNNKVLQKRRKQGKIWQKILSSEKNKPDVQAKVNFDVA